MSYITVIETAYECGPLGELDFKVECEYEAEDRDTNCPDYFSITEVRVKLPANPKSLEWLTVEADAFTPTQEDNLRVAVAEQYGNMLRDRADEAADHAYDDWRERQLYREVE